MGRTQAVAVALVAGWLAQGCGGGGGGGGGSGGGSFTPTPSPPAPSPSPSPAQIPTTPTSPSSPAPAPGPPATPAALTTTAVGHTRVSLSWAAAADATTYELERRAPPAAFAPVATSTTTTVTDAGLTAGTAYEWRVSALGPGGRSGPSNVARATTNRPPTLNAGAVPATIAAWEEVRSSLTATDPDGDRTRLRVVAGPSGVELHGGRWTVGASTGQVRWVAPRAEGGLCRIVVEAIDDAPLGGPYARRELVVRVHGWTHRSMARVGDVTGDGVADLVVGALAADVGASAGAGLVHVWRGGASPASAPAATLAIPNAMAFDSLTSGSGQTLQLADLDGDGVLDVVALASSAQRAGVASVGLIFVWRGGASLTGRPAPLATLHVPGARNNDQMGYVTFDFHDSAVHGQGMHLVDLDGDGVRDVIGVAPLADTGGVDDAGAVYVWRAGAGLSGAVAPTATLVRPTPVVDDHLGAVWNGEGVLVGDVTGDGTVDVCVGATYADVGVTNAGLVLVWSGAGLTGTPAPTATLSIPSAVASDLLGFGGAAPLLALADVSGDGTLDVVAGSSVRNVGAASDAGACWVWQGGAGLTGAAAPLATLTRPSPASNDHLGEHGEETTWLADVTGDGVLDLLVPGQAIDNGGIRDTGQVLVWSGGLGLNGTPAPLATLGSTNAIDSKLGRSVWVADLDGDGVRDVAAAAPTDSPGGRTGAGSVRVWKGGAGLTGTPAALADLLGEAAGDQLGSFTSQADVQFVDVTGDGTRDAILACCRATVSGVTNAGVVAVWTGGPGLTGTPARRARLHAAAPATNDFLTSSTSFVRGVQFADLDDDGTLDVVAGAGSADTATQVNAGLLAAWRGGATLVGEPAASELYGAAGELGARGLHVRDLTDDGVPDLVAGAPLFAAGRGELRVRVGGALPGGVIAASHVLTPSASGGQVPTANSGEAVLLVDVTGDGRPDVLALGSRATPGSVLEAGAVFVWTGGALGQAPLVLHDPGATAQDRLGE